MKTSNRMYRLFKNLMNRNFYTTNEERDKIEKFILQEFETNKDAWHAGIGREGSFSVRTNDILIDKRCFNRHCTIKIGDMEIIASRYFYKHFYKFNRFLYKKQYDEMCDKFYQEERKKMESNTVLQKMLVR